MNSHEWGLLAGRLHWIVWLHHFKAKWTTVPAVHLDDTPHEPYGDMLCFFPQKASIGWNSFPWWNSGTVMWIRKCHRSLHWLRGRPLYGWNFKSDWTIPWRMRGLVQIEPNFWLILTGAETRQSDNPKLLMCWAAFCSCVGIQEPWVFMLYGSVSAATYRAGKLSKAALMEMNKCGLYQAGSICSDPLM